MNLAVVSVIIPCYNAASWIEAAVESCFAQEPYVKEVIVIDDHSIDDSWEILCRMKDKHTNLVIERNLQKGGNQARNFGFSLSSGEYIQWLDADDLLLPGKLKAQVNFMVNNPEVDIVYSDWRIDTYNAKGRLCKSESKQARQYTDYLEELLRDNWVAPHVYLLRRGITEQIVSNDGWNPSTKIGQDREFFTKGALTGARFCYVSCVAAVYTRRLHIRSVSRGLPEQEKAAHIIKLLAEVKKEVGKQNWIDNFNKTKYEKILNAQILYNQSLYNIDIAGTSINLRQVDWKQIRGFRSRFKMLLRLLKNS